MDSQGGYYNDNRDHELITVDISSNPNNNSGNLFGRKKSKDPLFEEMQSVDLDDVKQFNVSVLIRSVWKDKDCQKLFLFICTMLGISLMEIFYGWYSSSLSLISTAFHTMFDCFALMISLAAMLLSKHKPTQRFSYGYDRYEILAGFSNGVFLLFVSLFLVKELIERAIEPESIELEHASAIVRVAVIDLIATAVGIVFFRDYAHVRSETMKAHDENLHGILIHLLVDCVGCIGVIVSTWMSAWGYQSADTIVALGIVALIIYTAVPICSRTSRILLQTTPLSAKEQIDKALREASTVEGVLECRNEHFWTQSPGVFVGSMYVRVRNEANEDIVLSKVRNLFAPIIKHLTIQVEKDFSDINYKKQHDHDHH